MRFAQAILETLQIVIAQDKGGDWRKLGNVRTMVDVFDTERHLLKAAYQEAQPVDISCLQLRAPISHPQKILAIGHNYTNPSHKQDKVTDRPVNLLSFAKLPSSINDPNGFIEWDPTLTKAVDYEAELAVVIGAKCKNIAAENALRYVLGYTCANDITARDLQHSDGQWTRSKSLDTFCPLGPWIVTTDEIPDPQQLALRCYLNGELVQSTVTSDMIFEIKTIISFLSQAFTLVPGDVILTGTPTGSGYYRDPKILLKDGDHLAVEIDGIGRLENQCHELVTDLVNAGQESA